MRAFQLWSCFAGEFNTSKRGNDKFGTQSSTNAKDTSVEIAWALRMGLVKTGESLQVPLGGRTYCNCCMRPLQVSCDQYNPVSSTVGVCQAESTNY